MRPAGTAVVVIEDHPLYRRALIGELDAAADLTVVGDYGSIEEFDHAFDSPESTASREAARPAVALLDLHLPGRSGAEGVAHLREAGLAILVLSAVDDPLKVLDAIAAGAAGYLTKGADGAEIATAARTIAAGGTYISPTLASYLLAASLTGPSVDDPPGGAGQSVDDPPGGRMPSHPVQPTGTEAHSDAAGLSARERSILGLVAAGETDRDIAAGLGLSVSTVRSHLDRIRHKTGRRRRPDLTRLAYQVGLTPNERARK